MRLVIAIDGPAASGKGTLARQLASVFSLPYLDTGLLYRAVGRKLLLAQQDPSNKYLAVEAAAALSPRDILRDDLRGLDAADAASKVATNTEVRAALFHFQRSFVEKSGGVVDGRDIGTVILPDADVKFFITADLAARAQRRWLELQNAGVFTTLDDVQSEMITRDLRDLTRAAAPLRAAEDAHYIDTTLLSAETVFELAKEIVLSRAPCTSTIS